MVFGFVYPRRSVAACAYGAVAYRSDLGRQTLPRWDTGHCWASQQCHSGGLLHAPAGEREIREIEAVRVFSCQLGAGGDDNPSGLISFSEFPTMAQAKRLDFCDMWHLLEMYRYE